MKKPLAILLLLFSFLSAQETIAVIEFEGIHTSQKLPGTRVIQQQFLNGEYVFMQAYMKYEFIPPNTWNTYIKGYGKTPFDLKDEGWYAVKGDKLGLSYWDENEVTWGSFTIEGDSLLTILYSNGPDELKMVYKRNQIPPGL